MQSGNLHLNYTQPVVASDGHTIFITDQGPVTLVFFQVRGQAADHIDADVVSAVRFHNLDELKGLQKGIDEAIEQHKNQQKQQKNREP